MNSTTLSSQAAAPYDPNSGPPPNPAAYQDPNQYYQDPNLTSAGTAATNASAAAGQAQAADMSLPSALQKALLPLISQKSDPTNMQQFTDLSKLIADTRTPLSAVDPNTNPNVSSTAVLDPTQLEDLISQRLGNDAGALNADMKVQNARYGGISDIINSNAAAHASVTQQLLSAASVAQQHYQQLFNTAQQEAANAVSANTYANQLYSTQTGLYGQIKGANIGAGATIQAAKIQQKTAEETNAAYQSKQAAINATNDAKNTTDKNAFLAYWSNRPDLLGGSATASRIWNLAHPSNQANAAVSGSVSSLIGGLNIIKNEISGGGQTKPPLSSFNH